jgi:transposase
VVRLVGQPPVGGQRYDLERLRCGLCGEVQTAPLPEEAGASKYDPTMASMIALLRFGQGVPWNRIQQLQAWAGIPLPASVQWELVRDATACGPEAVYGQLLWEAAQGDLMHDRDRRGVFTTNILSVAESRPTISLFFTGPRHSGENLRELLAARVAGLPPPMQMCEALSRNMPGDLKTIVANCLSHARRNFYELIEVFPAERLRVLECFKTV